MLLLIVFWDKPLEIVQVVRFKEWNNSKFILKRSENFLIKKNKKRRDLLVEAEYDICGVLW